MIKPLAAVKKFFRGNVPGELRPDPTADFWYNLVSAPAYFGGMVVNADTAQKIATVYACTQAIAETIAMIPARMYRELDYRTMEETPDHALHTIFARAPNGFMDPFEFWEKMVVDLYNWGNAYALVLRTKSGSPYQLVPYQARYVTPRFDEAAQRVKYIIRRSDGKPSETKDQYDIFHLKFRTEDNITGRSPIEIATGTFGFGLALQQYLNRTFENGAFLNGFLTSPFAFQTDEARDNFMQSFRKYMGVQNSGKFELLEQGVDFKPFQQTNQQAELPALMRLSNTEIMKIYRMPPPLVQDIERGSSYATVEQLAIAFRTYTIAPVATRIEMACNRQLLLENEEDMSMRFNLDAMERGDLKARTESLVSQLQYGLKTINEARHYLGDNPLDEDNADQPLVSHNQIPLQMIGQTPTSFPNFPGTNNPSPSPAAPAPLKPEPQDKPDLSPEQTNSMVGKLKPIFSDTLRRMYDIEVKAIKKATKKDGFLKWLDGFYPSHVELMRESLRPICKSASDILGRDDAEKELDGYLRGFLAERHQILTTQLEQVIGGTAEFEPPDIDSLLTFLTGGDHANN